MDAETSFWTDFLAGSLLPFKGYVWFVMIEFAIYSVSSTGRQHFAGPAFEEVWPPDKMRSFR
jgi:hypothetical protein